MTLRLGLALNIMLGEIEAGFAERESDRAAPAADKSERIRSALQVSSEPWARC